jgi:hypothetical protein
VIIQRIRGKSNSQDGTSESGSARRNAATNLMRAMHRCGLFKDMATRAIPARRSDPVKQFSVFTANRLGRLHDLIHLLSAHSVHVVALTVLDTTDSSIMRLVVDDPERARSLLLDKGFAFTESELLVVEVDGATKLNDLMAALLEAELNINYLYSFIPHPQGKSMLAFSMEDNEMAEEILIRHQFRTLRQSDISR